MFTPRDLSLSHHYTGVKFLRDWPLTAHFFSFFFFCHLLAALLTSRFPSCRSKWRTSRISRTSSAWWLWPGPTPPPSPTFSPSMTSASRRLATTTRPTCKTFRMRRFHKGVKLQCEAPRILFLVDQRLSILVEMGSKPLWTLQSRWFLIYESTGRLYTPVVWLKVAPSQCTEYWIELNFIYCRTVCSDWLFTWIKKQQEQHVVLPQIGTNVTNKR